MDDVRKLADPEGDQIEDAHTKDAHETCTAVGLELRESSN